MHPECFYIVTVLWVFSVCLHEFAHAWTAYQGGDHTVAEKGYLTFNPLKYTHPVTSILLPLVFVAMGGIGLPGGAVYINRHLLRSKAWDTWVSLAGPATNLVLILILGALFKFNVIAHDPTSLASVSLAFLLHLQISALILNLLPIPPLDGFQAIAPWLPEDVRERAFAASNMGMFVLFIAISFVPSVNHFFWSGVHFISNFMGIERELIDRGWYEFRFWAH